MTLSPTSSPPFEFNYRRQLAKSGLRNRPPETLPSSWGLRLTGPFDFSPVSDRPTPKPSQTEPQQATLAEIPRDARADELRATIQAAAAAQRITPEAVAAYARLHLVRDDGPHAGEPIEPAAHHWLWLQLLCDQRIRKVLIIAPPESAKTTWVISAYLGCYIGIFPQQNIIIGSATAELAAARSVSLRATVDSEVWRETFPDVLPVRAHDGGLPWGTTKWSMAPDGIPFPGRLHPTIAAYGTGGTIEGGRADLLLGDDLLNFTGSRSPTQRKATKDWAHASFLSRRKSVVGRAIVIGTQWHPDDYLSDIRSKGDWVVCHVPLLGDGQDFYATIAYPDDVDWNRLGEPVAGAQLERAA